jgi:hypothetical protein
MGGGGWQEAFVAVTALLGGSPRDARDALDVADADAVEPLLQRLACPSRGVRAAALAKTAVQVAAELQRLRLA